MNSVTKLLLAGISLIALTTLSCEEYNSPPEATLRQPDGGAFVPGVSLVVDFSEPIQADTFKFRIYGDVRDIELEIPDDADPIIDTCSAALSPCGDEVTMTLAEDRMSATIVLDEEGIGAPGPPLILDIFPGLADDDGNQTGVHFYFDFQFREGIKENQDPVEFDQGQYILVGSVDKPIPAVLTIIADIKTLEDGTFILAGAEGDPISPDLPNNTANPAELKVDDGDLGWTVHVTGNISVGEDGIRRVQTEPTIIRLPLGPLSLELLDLRLFAEVTKDENGKDKMDGTLSFSKIVLTNTGTNRSTEYEAGAAAVQGLFVTPEEVPKGHPVICKDNCGAVTGYCVPPTPFPADGFCDEWETEQVPE